MISFYILRQMLLRLLQPWIVIVACTVALMIGLWGALIAAQFIDSDTISVTSAILAGIGGPIGERIYVPDFLPWFVIHLIPSFAIGGTFVAFSSTLSTPVLLRLGRRSAWLLSIIVCIVIFSICYSLITIAITWVGIQVYAGGSDLLVTYSPFDMFPVSAPILFVDTLIVTCALLTVTIINLSLLQIGLYIVTHRVKYGLLLVAIMCIVSWITPESSILQTILPSTQSMIMRHPPFIQTAISLSFGGSLLWACTQSLIIAGFSMVRFADHDFLQAR